MSDTNVSLDLESTLANISEPFKDEYERRNGVRPSQWTTWGFDDAEFDAREFMKITGSNWKRRANEIPVTEKGVMAKVHNLYKNVDRLDVVTGRKGHREIMKAWLDTHGIRYDEFVIADSQEAKADLGYDVYIDDCPMHSERLNDAQTFLLYDQPYNRDITLPDGSHRIRSIRDAIEYVT